MNEDGLGAVEPRARHAHKRALAAHRQFGAGSRNSLFILRNRAYDFSALIAERGDGAYLGHPQYLGRLRHHFLWQVRQDTGNFWAEPGLLKRCILRSLRRVGWCEFSARLFLAYPLDTHTH